MQHTVGDIGALSCFIMCQHRRAQAHEIDLMNDSTIIHPNQEILDVISYPPPHNENNYRHAIGNSQLLQLLLLMFECQTSTCRKEIWNIL